jgi:hypothetical protein
MERRRAGESGAVGKVRREVVAPVKEDPGRERDEKEKDRRGSSSSREPVAHSGTILQNAAGMENERRVRVAVIAIAAVLALQFAANVVLLRSVGLGLPDIRWVASFMLFVGFAVGGVLLGAIVAASRGETRLYLAAVNTWRWRATTLLLIAGITLLGLLYGLLKIAVHMARPVKYDALLWKIDSALFLGSSPNVFLLELFSHPLLLRVFDWLYPFAFMGTVVASLLLIFGWPSNRERIGFLGGNVLLWLGGAWLYFAFPSLGPAYAYFEVWDEVREYFPWTQATQNALLENHLLALRMAAGERDLPVSVHMGIGAFPSLHVAFHALFAFWLQRLVPRLRLLGWVMVGIVFIGSVITGWHYLVDSLAGLGLAWIAWRAGAWVGGGSKVVREK